MNIVLAFISGIVVTIMNSMNSVLSDHFGLYISVVIIHLIGLTTIFAVCKIKHAKLTFDRKVPLYLYTGGVVGVFTVIFNNITLTAIGASLITVLGLLGQICTSLVLEHFGWFHSLQSKITKEKLISIIIILIGIGVML